MGNELDDIKRECEKFLNNKSETELFIKSKLKEAEQLFLSYKLDIAYKIFRNLAKKGTGRAMYFMGCYYENGYAPVKQDFDKALEWYRKGCEKGDALCTYYYSLEIDDDEDLYNDAFYDVLHMAESGDIFAQKEFDLEKAAIAGEWECMIDLGKDYYEKGQYDKSIKWLMKAAEKGVDKATQYLKKYYCQPKNDLKGLGTWRDTVDDINNDFNDFFDKAKKNIGE